MDPIVSIISSVFDGDKYIQNFLENITQQTIFNKCELILINPNSPGNEFSVINYFMEKYSNILFHTLDKDPGLYETWNIAARMAKGRYISNANLDDIRSPEHLEKHITFLEKNPKIDTVAAPLKVTKVAKETWDKNSADEIWFEHLHGEYGIENLFDLKNGIIIPQNITHSMPVWRKSLHERFGFFNEKDFGPHADWEFWLRCAKEGSISYMLDEALGLYFWNPQSHNRRFNNGNHMNDKIINLYYDQKTFPSSVIYENKNRFIIKKIKNKITKFFNLQ